MAYATTFLDRETVLAIARPILEERLREFGVADLELHEEIDFDGELVLRLDVAAERPFTARAMADARDAIRVRLLDHDDRRSVYLRPMSARVAE